LTRRLSGELITCDRRRWCTAEREGHTRCNRLVGDRRAAQGAAGHRRAGRRVVRCCVQIEVGGAGESKNGAAGWERLVERGLVRDRGFGRDVCPGTVRNFVLRAAREGARGVDRLLERIPACRVAGHADAAADRQCVARLVALHARRTHRVIGSRVELDLTGDFVTGLGDVGIVLLVLDQVGGFFIQRNARDTVPRAFRLGQYGRGRRGIVLGLGGLRPDRRDHLAVGIAHAHASAVARGRVYRLLGLQ
nr:hypothetical protein [Tanacetum cinerariifolium]